MSDIIDLSQPNGAQRTTVVRRPTTSYGSGSIALSGQTRYVSKNHDSKISFEASAPPGSKHAAALRELCLDVQVDPEPVTKSITGITSGRRNTTTVIVEAEDQAVVRRRAQTQRRTDERLAARSAGMAGATAAPKQWYRRETTKEVAIHGKSARGELFVSAPKGSEEAALYDDLVDREMGRPSRSGQSRPEIEEGSSRWLARLWRT